MPEAAVALLVTADEGSPVLPDSAGLLQCEVAADLSRLAVTQMSLAARQSRGAR